MEPITDDWVMHHFDHLSPELARNLHPALARARALCPVARSDAYEGGFWVLTRYEDILRVAQDWHTFSSELGITVRSRAGRSPRRRSSGPSTCSSSAVSRPRPGCSARR